MYILKNALFNIGRNKGRNILLAVVLFAVITMAAVSIVVRSAADLMLDDYKSRFGSEVFLVSEDSTNAVRSIEPDKLLSFGESKLLQSSQFIAKTGYTAQGMKAVDDGSIEEGAAGGIDGFNPKGAVYGSSRQDISDDFRKGVRVIVSGRKYQNDGECVVSKRFAELNGITAGDTITFESMDGNGGQKLIITGVYEDLSLEADNNRYGTALGSRANEIFTTLKTALSLDSFTQIGTLDARFFLKEPSGLMAFQKELTEKGLPFGVKATTDEAGYLKIIAPVEGLRKIASMFLYGVLALGSLVLALISIMAIRERKYEVGVLRAMGLKKGKLALGMLSEVIIITAVCLALGLGIAAQASEPIAGALLENQAEIARQTDSDFESGASQQDGRQLEPVRVSLDAKSVGLIVLISAALALASSLFGVLFIMRYEPRRILSERE